MRPTDERSNYLLLRERLLSGLRRGPAVEHRVRGELDAERAAEQYAQELRGVTLDFALLGIGPDGHTASLFPNDAALDERESPAVPVRRADVDRVTLTLPTLNAAGIVVFLAVGDDKAHAVRRAFGEPASASSPASLVRSESGTTYALVDRAAAAALKD